MNKVLRVILKLVGVAVALFLITFIAYFFNLDMKLTAAMEPILMKHYDRIKRDTHL